MRHIDWNKEEKETLEALGLKRNPLSGGGPLFDEDGRAERVLAQLKSGFKAIGFKLQDWSDLVKHANTEHKVPLFIISWVDGPKLLCMRPEDVEEILKHLKEEGAIEIIDHFEPANKAGEEDDPADLLRSLF